MNESVTGLLRGRMARRRMLAAFLPAAGASLALAEGKKSDESQTTFRLGGSFIGRDSDGNLLNFVQVPLDPAGKTAASEVMLPEYPQAVADLLSAFGADSLTNYVGEMKMISSDTARQTAIGYAVASGNPPAIVAIHLVSATAHFKDANTIEYSYISTIYGPSTDGFPDGDPLLGPLPPVELLFKRVAVVV